MIIIHKRAEVTTQLEKQQLKRKLKLFVVFYLQSGTAGAGGLGDHYLTITQLLTYELALYIELNK